MMEVMKDREVWWLNLELLPPPNSHGKAGHEERRTFAKNFGYLAGIDRFQNIRDWKKQMRYNQKINFS